MEHTQHDNVCVNYAFYNAMSVREYYDLSFDQIVDLDRMPPDFIDYLNTSVRKSKNYFFYLGCLIVRSFLSEDKNLDFIVDEFMSDYHYLYCSTGDLFRLRFNHQDIINMDDFCLSLQRYFSRKKKLDNHDIKIIQWMLDEFYDQAKVITKFYEKNQSILELRVRCGRKKDDNDGFLEDLLLLVQETKYPLKILHKLDTDLLCWLEETKKSVTKEVIANIASESVSKVFYQHPEMLMVYQEKDDSSSFIPLLSALNFFHSDQMKNILQSIIESNRFLLYLRTECALLMLDIFNTRHELLRVFIDRVFHVDCSDSDVYFPSTRIGSIDFFKDNRFFSIEDLVCFYRERKWNYQAIETLTYKMSIDNEQAEVTKNLLSLIDQELESMKDLATSGQDIKTIVSFEKIIELLLLDKKIDRSIVGEKIINIIDFFDHSGFGDVHRIVYLAHENKFALPEIYRKYLGYWDQYALCLVDKKISANEVYQRFIECGVISSPFEFNDMCDFFSDLDWRIGCDDNKIIIQRKNFNMRDIFDGFCRGFLGLKSDFFRYDDALNIADSVMLLNENTAVASWSEFVKYYTMGVNGQQYSCFMYHAHDYYQALAGVLLLLLKIYKPNLSLYYFTDDYGYYDYEFFGADELLFDQLIAELDFPCRKVKFFEPLQPTTEFLQIESELNKIISDQGFYSMIQPDDFIDLSKKMRGISRDQADWLVSMIPEMQAQASLPSEDIFAQALNVRNLFVALAREMIYDKRFANQLNGRKPLWTKEHAITQISKRYEQPSDWSLAMILNVFFDPDGLVSDFKCC